MNDNGLAAYYDLYVYTITLHFNKCNYNIIILACALSYNNI